MSTTELTWSADVPAIDHHSHAGYVRPGEHLHGFDGYEREYAMGHVEANVPHEVYVAYNRAVLEHDQDRVAALESEFGIPGLIEESIRFQSTTVHAASLAEGTAALYGTGTRATLIEESVEARRRDFAGLYDRALLLSGTEQVLTDIPEIDARVWSPDRYKPIARIDPYLFPFGHPPLVDRAEDARKFRRVFRSILDGLLATAGLDAPPAEFEDYRAFVLASITRRQESGTVGLKIASAYVRTLEFRRTTQADAAAAYGRLRAAERAGTDIDPADHRSLADFLVYDIAAHAVDRELPMQIHTGMGHTEPGLKLAGANPMLLEQFLDTPALNRLRVILIHGGFPYGQALAALSQARGNVFVDFSWMPYLHEHALHRMLQEWLEVLPANKVIFGTDTGSPEFHVSGTRRGRVALDAALTAGRASGLWSARQAGWLAERVLHQNLRDVYGLDR
ncbi:amidohydrolase family protein [Plantibacter sp. ME-Dv--P-122b]|uniref:amidohydrolase family protein n=1 Tax=Plantibacter sp. ME-Dv--P-122b TaxID=3040300 RepID=UPI00254EF306|nr:amidohydrolase family protein [Plantibacter sp. ME-Dv--P-122b]